MGENDGIEKKNVLKTIHMYKKVLINTRPMQGFLNNCVWPLGMDFGAIFTQKKKKQTNKQTKKNSHNSGENDCIGKQEAQRPLRSACMVACQIGASYNVVCFIPDSH